MWEAPTESRNPTPWGTRGNKDQTESHSTKCDTKKDRKNRKEKKKGRRQRWERKREERVTFIYLSLHFNILLNEDVIHGV